MYRFVLAVVATIWTAGAAAAADAPSFAYDAAAPLAATYGQPQRIAPGVISRSVRFASPPGNAIVGELISAAGKTGSHPGVLFVHWLGDPKTTNHTEFESDAIALAQRGATSLLVDAMWSGGEAWFNTMGVTADKDYRDTVNQVIDLRRALDLLMAQPGVDASRVAYVGHDFGAMMGAFLASADARPQYYVFMAGNPTLTGWYLLGKKPQNKDAYLAQMAPLDILAALHRAQGKAYLMQFSAHDDYIPAEDAMSFFNAAPLPRGAFFYDVDHSLLTPQAFKDRQSWLAEHLFDAKPN